jgi:hypothetical protein
VDTNGSSGGREDQVDKERRTRGLAKATQAYLLGVVLPLWTIPGFADWVAHRKTSIEKTSGTHESLTHTLMMAAVGVPTLMALLLEINASTILAFAGAFAVHEGIVIWDVAYAADRRRITTTEQHIHSFLEVLPFMSLSFMLCLHWDQVLALFGKGPSPATFAIKPKESPIPPAYLAGILSAITATIAIPYAEELLRCFRVDHTFLPRPKPAKPL